MSTARKVRSNASARLRLLCFHHAGGSAAAFNSWAAAFPSAIGIERVQLPGRVPGRGASHTRMTTLLPWVCEQLEPLLDRPFALYGQSLGALVAFEFARAIRKNGGRQPLALFVASRRAPQCPLTRTPLCSLPDAELIVELRAMGGLIDSLAGSSKWMEHFLPALRADLTISDL